MSVALDYAPFATKRTPRQPVEASTLRIHVRPRRSIFSNALNFRCSAIAAFVRCRDGIAHSAYQETAATDMPIRCLIGPAGSQDFEAQQRLVAPVRLVATCTRV